jgi:hypothetical protein
MRMFRSGRSLESAVAVEPPTRPVPPSTSTRAALERALLGAEAVVAVEDEAAATAGGVRSGMHALTMAAMLAATLDCYHAPWSEPPIGGARRCGSRGRTWSDACGELLDAYVDAVWSWVWKQVDRRLDMLYSLSDPFISPVERLPYATLAQSHFSFSIFLPFVDDHELFPSTVVVVLSLS